MVLTVIYYNINAFDMLITASVVKEIMVSRNTLSLKHGSHLNNFFLAWKKCIFLPQRNGYIWKLNIIGQNVKEVYENFQIFVSEWDILNIIDI